MAKFKLPSAAVLAARARRVATIQARAARLEWYAENVSGKVALTMKQRVMLATDFVKNKVMHNISKAVTVGKGPRGGRVVTDRSKPGEYPRADTTQLMKTIFSGADQIEPGVWEGFIGTPLDYGLYLETSPKLDRSFLKRTYDEELLTMNRLLTGPIK